MYVKLLLLFISLHQISAADLHLHDIKKSSKDIHLEYVLLNEDNPCGRECQLGSNPMTCQYTFLVEQYNTLSKACYDCPYNVTDCYRPDCLSGVGFKRSAVTVNRKLPGPAIEVCEGDEIVVDVVNGMTSESTSMHWHGQHQKAFPYMDGVPFVTQCPILPENTFRYRFVAANPGTHFWHSHIGYQRSDGVFGPLIVRQPKENNPHSDLYDYDLSAHVMSIIDWDETSGLEKFLAHNHNDGDNRPSTIIVNGMGRFVKFLGEDNTTTIYTPTARFTVEKGFRYRFRVINAGFLNCPIEIFVDNHNLTVINSDGGDFAAVEATSFITYAGERFDFILNADQDDGLYWIHYKGLMDCDERFKKAFQVAVLEYKGANAAIDDYPVGIPVYEDEPAQGTRINPINEGTEEESSDIITVPTLESLVPWDTSLNKEPDQQIYIGYDFYKLDNPHYHKTPDYGYDNVTNPKQKRMTPQLNHITMKIPTIPILPQRHQVTDADFCNETTVADQNCTVEFCECPHVIQVRLNTIVEMVLVDEGLAFDANHPMHLHGYGFRVVAMERLGSNTTVADVKEWDRLGNIKRNLENAPVKDTVTVPDGGFTIIRFNASSPGYWIFHCHIEFHSEVGMALVVKVGENEDMLPVPQNFPTCGNYIPEPEDKDCTKNNVLTKFENLFSPLIGEKCDDGKNRSSSGVLISGPIILIVSIIFIFFQ